jgi:hypothetical protein
MKKITFDVIQIYANEIYSFGHGIGITYKFYISSILNFYHYIFFSTSSSSLSSMYAYSSQNIKRNEKIIENCFLN